MGRIAQMTFVIQRSFFFFCFFSSSSTWALDDVWALEDHIGGTKEHPLEIMFRDSEREVINVLEPSTDSKEAGNDDPFGRVNLKDRVQVKQFALTYPQSGEATAKQALSVILKRESVVVCGVKYCVVSTELHKDGSPHLHVFLMLSNPYRYPKGDGHTWDFVTGKHGHYQRMKYPAKWLQYVIKGGSYVCFPSDFDCLAFIASREKKSSYKAEVVAKTIMEGQRAMKDLLSAYPGFLLINQRKVVDFINLCDDIDSSQMPLLKFPEVLQVGALSPKHTDVLKFFVRIQTNTWSEQYLPHLRIEGSTGIGKTYLVQLLSKFLRVYSVVYETHWWDQFNEDAFDIIVLDEYKSQKKIQLLNRVADGAMVPLPRRGTRPYLLKKRVPMLILSNFTWEESYPNVTIYSPVLIEAAKRRFPSVVFNDGEDLMSLVYWIKSFIAHQADQQH